MAFIFANGALEARPVFVGASAQQPTGNRIYDVGSHDFIESLDANFNGVVKVGTSIFISAAIGAERAQVSGTAERAIFGSGELYAGLATTSGVAEQLIFGEGALEAAQATTEAQVKLSRSAFGSPQAGVFRTTGSGIVARRLLLASGTLEPSGPFTVSGTGLRGSQGVGELQAEPATVIATTELERLVKHEAFGALHSLRATVSGGASKWVIGWGALQAQPATVYGNNFRATFADPARVTFSVTPRPILKTGVGGSLKIVATPQTLELGRVSYSWTLNADEDFEPMPEQAKSTETEVIVFDMPDKETLFHVEPRGRLKTLYQPSDYEVEPVTTTWHPEVKAA